MVLLPRRHVIVPFLLLTFLGAWSQQIYVFGVHLFVVRVLILVGLFRLFLNKPAGETRFAGGWNSVDTVVFTWALFRAFASIAYHGGDSGAVIFQGGFLWDVLGSYVLLRYLIRSKDDISEVVKVFAAITVVSGVCMLNEKLTDRNIFGYLGTVPVISEIREGSVRAQGGFAHPILAGVFAVTLVPLFWWLWQSGKSKLFGILGFVGSTVMMLTSASSTPLLSYGAAFVGLAFWRVRKKMRIFRWGMVLMLIGLHMVMKAPVWMLIGRVDLVAGNSGYHRAMLIDQCIRHFSDWWLIGTDLARTWGQDMWDLSNQFVAEAESGGLVALVSFIMVISRSFGRIGKARKIVEGDKEQEWFLFLLGVALLTHIVSYFGISYFDYTRIAWCAFIAIVIAATNPFLAEQKVEEPLEESADEPRVIYRRPEPIALPGKALVHKS